MDWKQAWVVIKTFLKSLIDSWYVIFTLVGVLVFASSFFVPEQQELWKKVLFSSGSLIVVSGGFSAMTRWLSVHGIVKKELENILFGKDYLKDNKRFDDVWDILVSTAVTKHMPSLGPHLHKEFLREYLPSEKEIFYEKLHQAFDVYWEDKANNMIKVVEKCDITLYTTNAEEHVLPYAFTANFPTEKNLDYEIETLKVDGTSRLSDVRKESEEIDGICTKKISYKLKLSGNTEYRYFRKMKRIMCLDYEPFIVVGSGWHTYKPIVTVNCHDDGIKAYFTSTGTLRNFVTIDGENNSGYMEEEYPDLMMKAQGYSIYFAGK